MPKTYPVIDQVQNGVDFTQVGQADYRGPYGYGRPAHGSDSNAQYGFGGPQPRYEARTIDPARPQPDPSRE
jgi:hypothetical protein